MKDIIKELYKHPENWVAHKHTLEHRHKLLAIWVANNRYGLSVYPGVKLSWWQRRKLWKAVVWWYDNRPISQCTSRVQAI